MKHVTFEIAKLLKEKGFDEHTICGYNGAYEPYHLGLIEFADSQRNSELMNSVYSAPTISDVVDWILEIHKIDIIVKYPESKTNKVEGINSVYYDLEIYKLNSGDAWKMYKFNQYSDKKQDVYLYGIEYTLNNLI